MYAYSIRYTVEIVPNRATQHIRYQVYNRCLLQGRVYSCNPLVMFWTPVIDRLLIRKSYQRSYLVLPLLNWA